MEKTPDEVAETAAKEAARLLEALKTAVDLKGIPYDEVGRRLGRKRGYMSHLFAGRIGFAAEHFFLILAAIDVEPRVFFAEFCGHTSSKAEGESIEDAIVRTLRRLGITPPADEEKAGT